MDWAALQTALIAWAESITGLTTYWQEAPRGQAYGPYCTLSVLGGIRAVGRDASKYLGDADDNNERVFGLREITISLRVWSDNAYPDESPVHYLSRAMIHMHRQPRLEELRDAGLGIIASTSLVDETIDADNRRTPIAVLDVRMITTVREDFDDAPVAGIEHVEGSFDAGDDGIDDFDFDSDDV